MPLRGERLKEIRKSRGYTQTELGKALGTPQQQVAKWENEIQDPSADTVGRMAMLLECSADYLLGLVDTPTEHLQQTDLSEAERALLLLYRRGNLRDLITRLVGEIATPRGEP
ncbi:HTH-type transcriptional regulator ImmR [Anaerolineae bacterium]|nr:HTH-type transcriptional regulator ImmR [Anaerolineae bacterium]